MEFAVCDTPTHTRVLFKVKLQISQKGCSKNLLPLQRDLPHDHNEGCHWHQKRLFLSGDTQLSNEIIPEFLSLLVWLPETETRRVYVLS